MKTNIFTTISKYIKYINPTTISAFVAVIAAVKAFIEIFDETDEDGDFPTANNVYGNE